MTADVQRTIDAVGRIESPRLIGGLARIVRDVGVAEEFAQDALVAALEEWPRTGVPDNPGAWLTTTAKRRALDFVRTERRRDAQLAEIGRRNGSRIEDTESELDGTLDDDLGDDVLRLVCATCHPALAPEARVALTLRLFGGLSTGEIARAYLTHQATIAQRIVRAKRTLAERDDVIDLPRGADLEARLASVLEVVYLVFHEGYAATAGESWLRAELCEEALRLGRVLAQLVPREPEVHGLVALMEIQASRSRARVGPDGAPVLLLDQDRGKWDRLLIRRGLAALERALDLAVELGRATGPYALQAALAACHACASTAAETDWRRIVALYGELARTAPSPVVELNRAVAVGMAEGPAAGLALVDALADEPALASYPFLPAARGDLLAKLGRHAEACAEFERAASLTRNEREAALLRARAETSGCAAGPSL